MQRADHDVAFMLQYENIAWYEDGKVKILDRRIYPARAEFVTCHTHQEVAQAITDMVTQSAGPYTAVPMGMALAAHECRGRTAAEQMEYLRKAAHTISHARPTTVKRMALLCDLCLAEAERALAAGEDTKHIRLFCPETRPYFQGARLTATVCRDMGFDVTVISDNMPAFVMQREGVDVFTTAADAICCDGHVVNKVGTFQNAIVAKYMGIPYFVTGAPDQGHPTVDTVHIEMRDPNFTLQAMGVRTAAEGVKGYYPAFDITPPHLVSGVVTDLGIYSPYDLHRYFTDGHIDEHNLVV